MQNKKDDIEEFNIDINFLFRTLFRYKVLIFVCILIFTVVSAVYAYFKPNIYSATATVEVGIQNNQRDMISEAMYAGSMDLDADMEIIQSRFLTQKALKTVNFTHRYYTTTNFKEKELYKDAPFRVDMTKGYHVSFDLYPVDEKSYRLVVKDGNDGWDYDKTHQYGEEIKNNFFHLTVTQNSEKAFTENKYRFVVLKYGAIAGGISVSSKNYSPILHITYQDTVALRAKDFVNALAEAYIQQNIDRKIEEATLTISFIDEQLKDINRNLQFSAEALEDFKISTNAPDLSTKTQAIISRMNEYEKELSGTYIEEKMLASIDAQIKSGKNFETLSVAGLKLSDTVLSSLIKDIQDILIKKKILLQDYTEEYPAVAKLTNQIKQMKKNLIQSVKSLEKNIQERKELLKKLYDEEQKKLNTLPSSEREYGRLYRKFTINEKIYSYLLEKKAETEILKASTISKNRVLDTALLQNAPVHPNRKMIVMIGMSLGLLLGVFITFLMEYFDDRIKEEEDVKNGTQVPILGTIPHITNLNMEEEIKVLASPKSLISEAFRMVRTNLNFMSSDDKKQLIAVTSTIGGEGKSTICVNLGAIISLTGKKTIILNLDMRKPTLHKKFNLSNEKGMSNFLSNQSSITEVIQHTKYDNLDIISSGPIPPNPSELIQSNNYIEALLEQLREMYDVIIMDTPPIGLVTDARTLMDLADVSIYVVRMNYSRKKFFDNIEKLFVEDKVQGMGVLINDQKMSKNKYGYNYGYDHSYYDEGTK